jgi:hypothetical protein
VDVFVERGPKKAFAVAVDWPGWARSGKDEEAALAALLAYAERYRRSLELRAPNFVTPHSIAGLEVVERMEGNATTDFGAPGAIRSADEKTTDKAELDRRVDLLRRAWNAFDEAASRADGAELPPTGPRGGGRSLSKIRRHYLEAEDGYLHALGGKAKKGAGAAEIREAFVAAVYARARGDLPDIGPRGGRRWPAAFAIRRSAWHALDHAWEIEDRVASADAQD